MLAEWAQEVRQNAGGKAVAAGNIHLTLAFLGEADPQRAARAAARVRAGPFELPIDTAKYWTHNKIVWVGPKETPPALLTLVERLQLELFKEEFVLERRPFAAHITLLRKAGRPAKIPPLPPCAWPASEFTLVQSESGAGSSIYSIIAPYGLRAGG